MCKKLLKPDFMKLKSGFFICINFNKLEILLKLWIPSGDILWLVGNYLIKTAGNIYN